MNDERDRTLTDLDSDADDGPYAPRGENSATALEGMQEWVRASGVFDERDCGCQACRDSEGTWA